MSIISNMQNLLEMRNKIPEITNSVWGNYETCGSYEPGTGRLAITNMSQPGVFTLDCESFVSPAIMNYHSHPKEQNNAYWSGFPSNTDFKSLVSVVKRFRVKASDNIICNKGIFYYATTDKLLRNIDLIDETLVDKINPNAINDRVNGRGTLETIVNNFISEMNQFGWFEFICVFG